MRLDDCSLARSGRYDTVKASYTIFKVLNAMLTKIGQLKTYYISTLTLPHWTTQEPYSKWTITSECSPLNSGSGRIGTRSN